MDEHLEVRRRVLIVAYRRYLVADQALQAARASALSWFPEAPPRSTMPIGDPGSRIRRLYDRRDRALARLSLARQELEEAQRRMRQRRIHATPRVVCISLY
jgi:hypothetical protein